MLILSLYDHSGEWARPYREAGTRPVAAPAYY